MPALLSSLIKAPAGDLAGGLAADGARSRACWCEWLARVPDHRSVMGRWHPLEYVLALAICAFTAAGHDSPAAVAEREAGCSQRTLGGRRDPWAERIRPPSARTFARVFTGLDAEAFNAAVCRYLASLARQPGGRSACGDPPRARSAPRRQSQGGEVGAGNPHRAPPHRPDPAFRPAR
ncbi:MAG TPA: transposase family protein [Trebonia sp.]